MYVAHKSTFAATGASFSVSGHFTHAAGNINHNGASHAKGGKKASEDLVVVCDNILTLYEVWGGGHATAAGQQPLGADELAKRGELKFVATLKLAASPTAVSKITIGGSSTASSAATASSSSSGSGGSASPYPDQIVLAFDHEHLSVIGYDRYRRAFSTTALYRLGEQSIAREDVGVPSLLSVDPLGRCIAMLLRRRYLALIPITNPGAAATATSSSPTTVAAAAGAPQKPTAAAAVDNWGDDEDDDEAETKPAAEEEIVTADGEEQPTSSEALPPLHTAFGAAKYLDLFTLPDGIRNIRDMAFVPQPHASGSSGSGSNLVSSSSTSSGSSAAVGEPTLGFLCEREPTWAGRAKLIDVAAGKRTANLATCCLAWLIIQASSLAAETTNDTASAKQKDGADDDNPMGAAFASSATLRTHQALTQLLPFNATRLVPCALPQCDAGFLVLSANAVLHATRTRTAGFYSNRYGHDEATCSNSTRIHWSRLEKPARGGGGILSSSAAGEGGEGQYDPSDAAAVMRMAENNMSFADAVAAMVGPRRAIIACPSSGLVVAIDIATSGRDVRSMACIPIAATAIASTMSVVSAAATSSSDVAVTNFFLGSAVGDSAMYSVTISASGDSSPAPPPRLLAWPRSVLRNYGPIVGADIGDFTTPEEDSSATGDTTEATTAENDAASPYEHLLIGATAVPPDPPQPFVPLQQSLAASDAVMIGGEGAYGHVTIARQHVRPITLVAQQGDCVAVFVANPNDSRAAEQKRSSVASGKRGREGGASSSDFIGGSEDEAEEEEAKRRLGDGAASSAAEASQVLFLSHANATSVFELSNTVTHLKRKDEAEKKADAADGEGGNEKNDNENDEDDECPWRTNARTVWAGAVTVGGITRMVQVTDVSVVIVEDSPSATPFTSKRRLVAEIELIQNEGEENAAAEASSSAPAPVLLRHAFVVANTSLLCATSTAGISYVVDVVDPSVHVLNSLLAPLLAEVITAASADGGGAASSEPLRIASVCDGSEAGLSDTNANGCSESVIFISEGSTGALVIASLRRGGGAESAPLSLRALVPPIQQFSTLPQAVLAGGAIAESPLDIKRGGAGSGAAAQRRAAGGKGGNKRGGAASFDVTEMICSNMGLSTSPASSSSSAACALPMLFALSACGEVAAYQLRPSDAALFKVDQRFVDVEFAEEKLESLAEKKRRLNLADDVVTVQDTTAKMRPLTQRLRVFSDLGGTSSSSSSNSAALAGVFVSGRRSSLFMSRAGRLVHHHLQAGGPLRGFAEISSPAMGRARFVLAGEGHVSYCCLERRVNYLEDWCVRREPLRRTPHLVGYAAPFRACFIVASERVPFRPAHAPFDINVLVKTDGEGQAIDHSVATRVVQPFISAAASASAGGNGGEEDVPVPMTDRYSVALYSASPFKKVDEMPLEENEQALASAVGTLYAERAGVPITDATGAPIAHTVFAIATAFPLGEDITCRGRLLLLKPTTSTDASTGAATATGKGSSKKRIAVLHSEECRGPVTAVTFVGSRYVACAVAGTVKVFAYDSRAERLTTVSFLGAGNYIPTMTSFKSFLLFGDLFNSVTLGKIHGGNKTAYVLARHPKELEVTAVDICYKGKELGIVAASAGGAALLLSYEPQRDAEGRVVGGTLAERSGARLSAPVSATARLRIPKSVQRSELSDDSVILYATAGGELGLFHPVAERVSYTLSPLAAAMCLAMPHPAGLNPALFRSATAAGSAVGSGGGSVGLAARQMIDGEGIIDGFMMLSLVDRAALAASAKVSLDRVLNAICGLTEQSFLVL